MYVYYKVLIKLNCYYMLCLILYFTEFIKYINILFKYIKERKAKE